MHLCLSRAAHEAHNFFTRDGDRPADLYPISLAQFLKYPMAKYIQGQVVDVQKNDAGNFVVKTKAGEDYEGKTLLLAQGIGLTVPNIPGLKEISISIY